MHRIPRLQHRPCDMHPACGRRHLSLRPRAEAQQLLLPHASTYHTQLDSAELVDDTYYPSYSTPVVRIPDTPSARSDGTAPSSSRHPPPTQPRPPSRLALGGWPRRAPPKRAGAVPGGLTSVPAPPARRRYPPCRKCMMSPSFTT